MKHIVEVLLILGLLGCASNRVATGSSSVADAPADRPLYYVLAVKDLDEMVLLVKTKIDQSRGSSTKMTVLKEALWSVYARPDDDGMIEKVIGPLRTEIEEFDAWESTFSELTGEAISTLQSPSDVKPSIQTSNVVFLQNVIAQMKPKARDQSFERSLLKKIRDAKIELTPEMRAERRLRLMRNTASPSEMAAQVIGPAAH